MKPSVALVALCSRWWRSGAQAVGRDRIRVWMVRLSALLAGIAPAQAQCVTAVVRAGCRRVPHSVARAHLAALARACLAASARACLAASARVATSPALVCIVVNARTDLAAICAGRHAAFCAEEPRCHLRGLLSLPFARRSLAAIRASLQFSAVAMLPGVANACHCAVSAGICGHSLPVLS